MWQVFVARRHVRDLLTCAAAPELQRAVSELVRAFATDESTATRPAGRRRRPPGPAETQRAPRPVAAPATVKDQRNDKDRDKINWAIANAPTKVFQLIGDPQSGLADDTTTNPFGETTVDLIHENKSNTIHWFKYDYAGNALKETHRDSRLSDYSKNLMYILRAKDPQRWTFDALARKFHVRKQRVVAILALKEMEAQAIQQGELLAGPLSAYACEVDLDDLQMDPATAQPREFFQPQEFLTDGPAAGSSQAAAHGRRQAAAALGLDEDFIAQDSSQGTSPAADEQLGLAPAVSFALLNMVPQVHSTANKVMEQLRQLLASYQYDHGVLAASLRDQVARVEEFHQQHFAGSQSPLDPEKYRAAVEAVLASLEPFFAAPGVQLHQRQLRLQQLAQQLPRFLDQFDAEVAERQPQGHSVQLEPRSVEEPFALTGLAGPELTFSAAGATESAEQSEAATLGHSSSAEAQQEQPSTAAPATATLEGSDGEAQASAAGSSAASSSTEARDTADASTTATPSVSADLDAAATSSPSLSIDLDAPASAGPTPPDDLDASSGAADFDALSGAAEAGTTAAASDGDLQEPTPATAEASSIHLQEEGLQEGPSSSSAERQQHAPGADVAGLRAFAARNPEFAQLCDAMKQLYADVELSELHAALGTLTKEAGLRERVLDAIPEWRLKLKTAGQELDRRSTSPPSSTSSSDSLALDPPQNLFGAVMFSEEDIERALEASAQLQALVAQVESAAAAAGQSKAATKSAAAHEPSGVPADHVRQLRALWRTYLSVNDAYDDVLQGSTAPLSIQEEKAFAAFAGKVPDVQLDQKEEEAEPQSEEATGKAAQRLRVHQERVQRLKSLGYDHLAAYIDYTVVGRVYDRGSGERNFVRLPTFPTFEGYWLNEFDHAGEGELSRLNRLVAQKEEEVMFQEFHTHLLFNLGLLGEELRNGMGQARPQRPEEGWSYVVSSRSPSKQPPLPGFEVVADRMRCVVGPRGERRPLNEQERLLQERRQPKVRRRYYF